MAFEDTPWTGPTLSDFGGNVNAYCDASLIDLNDGTGRKTAGNCKLQIKRNADAPVNMGALRACAAILAGARGGVVAPADAKRAAARRLVSLMRQAKMQPGDNLMRMSGMMGGSSGS